MAHMLHARFAASHVDVRRLRGCGAEREAVSMPRAVEATVCVEVLRACGLAAGVREAAAWLGGGKPLTPKKCLCQRVTYFLKHIRYETAGAHAACEMKH